MEAAVALAPRRRWRPEELVLAVFALALGAIIAATGELPRTFAPPVWRIAWRLHVYFLGCVAALALGLRLRGQRAVGAVLRDFLPFYAVVVLYEALSDLTPVLRPAVRDATLVRIDRALLHVDAAVWMGRLATPLVSHVMVLCYGSYFVLPAMLAAAMYATGERPLFRDLMLAGVITSVIGFTGYLLVPAVGPYAFQAGQFPAPLPGAYCPVFLGAINDFRGLARDCFPSLHAAHVTVVMVFARRFRRWLFPALMPLAVGLYLSTLYLRFHYVVDLAAGALTAAVAVWLAPRIHRVWG
jgi:membrane-associated phospholipid phosphatase